jgi:hypothetical protein
MRRIKTLIGAVMALALLATPTRAAEIGNARLDILGQSLEVVIDTPIATAIDIPAIVQTKFGGRMNADAPAAPGLIAIAELTGPGIDTPITVTTQPGHTFVLPALRRAGDYTLQNIRLATDPTGQFVQLATPSSVNVNVSDVLRPSVTVRQLTPDDLRARGIALDTRNYDYYEYTFVFAINGQTVQVPYSVVVDRRTHEALPPSTGGFTFPLPQTGGGEPPRFQPPDVSSGVLVPDDVPGVPDNLGNDLPPAGGIGDRGRRRASIPAAIVLPTSFGVLHQFFAVILKVSNDAPAGSTIRLDAVRAQLAAPNALRVAKIDPAFSIGQAVPVRAADGSTFLIAQAEGSVQWTLEALRSGTHVVNIDLNATYRVPNQDDVAMHGTLAATITVSDPRFQINFVHPDTVRKDEAYTAYAFVTNTSTTSQTVTLRLDGNIPLCASGTSAFNICATEALPAAPMTIASGATVAVPYKLQSKINGHIFATAGTADDAIALSVGLSMGVSASGVPLSPATLLLPYYAQFIDHAFVDSWMPLLGLGYSLATAPVNDKTAKFPRLIRNDVFRRAQDIARAGQRSFVIRRDRNAATAEEDRDPIFHLVLDIFGNIERTDLAATSPSMAEWDLFRRLEDDGRNAEAATARLLASAAFANGRTTSTFVSDFAPATSHRTPYALAVVHGAPVSGATRPYAMTVTAGSATMTNVAELGGAWKRDVPYGALTQWNGGGENGELALVARWKESLRISVVPAASSFTLELIYPDAGDALRQAKLDVTGATIGQPVTFTIDRGAATIAISGATAAQSNHAVDQAPLQILASAQDLALDGSGSTVTMLTNRPIAIADASTLRDGITISTTIAALSYDVTRRNDAARMFVNGAALQDDGRLLVVTFAKALASTAVYRIGTVTPLRDLRTQSASVTTSTIPRIDNTRPAGVVYGEVVLADGSPLKQTSVALSAPDGVQYDVTSDAGGFLFEYVPRDAVNGRYGNYHLDTMAPDGKFASLDGTIRTVGELQHVKLVFLGRGSAEGHVKYSDGTPVAAAQVSVGNSIYGELHTATTDASGHYLATDLPVGPITFAAVDAKGIVTYATAQLRVAGERITQDLVIQKRALAGFGKVRVTVRRSDRMSDPNADASLVAGAHVGVYSQGYGLTDAYTDSSGRALFDRVPAGPLTLLASEFSITRKSTGAELDLDADEFREATLILDVPTDSTKLVTIRGHIFKDDPAAPANEARITSVAGAIVTFKGLAPVAADAAGNYVYPDVPLTFRNGGGAAVFDPATGRRGAFTFPALQAGQDNTFDITLRSTTAQGKATLRVRVTSATGEPVTGYRVLSPGFPAESFAEVGGGVYERNVDVPQTMDVWAIGNGHAKYGDQTTHGKLAAEFDGQIAVLDLRLPGQGTILGTIETLGTCATPGCTPPWIRSPGPIDFAYPEWSDAEQQLIEQDHVFTPAADGIVHATNIPAGVNVNAETVDHPAGYATAGTAIGFEGDVKTIALRLSSLGTVSGRVVNYDGTTPIAGATITLTGGAVDAGTTQTQPDGSFVIPGVAAHASFRVVAEAIVDGLHRKGFVDAATPIGGGPVGNLVIVMRQQAKVSGTVRDANGAAVPLAHYWLRELAWPFDAIGSPAEPLVADKSGAFFVNNVFTGPFRVSASSPTDQEATGSVEETLVEENADRNGLTVTVGGAGTGTVSVTVYDANSGLTTVPNAEVSLLVGGRGYDFAITDAAGVAVFEQIPVGHYTIRATSRAVGRSGVSDGFDIVRDGIANVRVSLTFIGTVRGTVVDPDTNPPSPVRGAAVFLDANGLDARASTDANGAFVFNGIPEGTFKVSALDLDSGRHAVDDTPYALSTLVQNVTLQPLALEKSGTLHVRVFLPNDTGGAGALAPLVDVQVVQRSVSYSRESQGSGSLAFEKLFTSRTFSAIATELGGEARKVTANGSFAAGSADANLDLIFPTTGSVEATVLGPNDVPQRGVAVTVIAAQTGYNVFTDEQGFARVTGLPLGSVWVGATSGQVSASDGGTIVSHATPFRVTLRLGNRITVTGKVFAEEGSGIPSAGTRVIASIASSLYTNGTVSIETRTDANGEYLFTGVPVGNTSVNVICIGADDVTVGAHAGLAIPNTQTTAARMPDAKLDGTPPRVVSIVPANNANSVSPTSSIVVTFSEELNRGDVDGSNFQLTATDDNTAAPVNITSAVTAGGFRVTLTPRVPLKSNVVYRFLVRNVVRDLSGNVMQAPVGSSFTTVDYTEPRVVKVTPSTLAPISDGTVFKLTFNKPIDATAFAPNGGGTLTLARLDSYKGNIAQSLTFTTYPEPLDAATLNVAPLGVAIEPSSFYRITINGARDTQPVPAVQTAAQVFDFFSFDHTTPTVAITTVPALAPGGALVAGQSYSFVPIITDAPGVASRDIASVDWTYPNGTTTRLTTPDYSIAPLVVAAADGTFTLKAKATDLSHNVSELTMMTWNVVANQAPQNVAVTTNAPSTFVGSTIAAHVAFTDEGTVVSAAIAVTGTLRDGSAFTFPDALIHPRPSQQITRANATAAWPAADFTIDVPPTLASGTPIAITAIVTDSANKASTPVSTSVAITPDTIAPQLTITSPIAETSYSFGNGTTTFAIRASAIDAESGLARVDFAYDGKTISVPVASATRDSATGAYVFTTTATVTAKNIDTRIHITATAYDNGGNATARVVDVIYTSVGITNVPRAAWITPLDGAALVAAEANVPLTLRLRATAEPAGFKPTVHFTSSALVTAPPALTAPTSGSDVYEQVVHVTVPASGSFTITAFIDDADPSHQVVLPIAIDVVTADVQPVVANFEVNAQNAATYASHTLVVRGSGVRLNIDTPVTLRNLVVLDGATIGTRDGVKLDVTIADRLYVDGDSSLDVSGKGYRGGWASSDDNTFHNNSANGMTLGGTIIGGAAGASASHGGSGGADFGTTTNATYGSITAPSDFGAGGSGAPASAGAGNVPGGNGGGAIALHGSTANSDLGRFVIAGAIRANGDDAVSQSRWNAGAGGSVLITARALVTGPATRIAANGGDDSAADATSRGAGGGRVAIAASERLELDSLAAELQARGGRNATTTEGATFVDGGAGTLFLLRPHTVVGDLIVSSFDDRNATSTHLTRPTPLTGAMNFDSVTIGPRALARFDDAYPAAIAIDPTAVAIHPAEVPAFTFSSTPATGGTIVRGGSIATSYDAMSKAGIGSVAMTFAPAGALVPATYAAYPLDTTVKNGTIAVPLAAPLGAATLNVRITDRAERFVDVAPVALTIIDNLPPALDKFAIDPSALVDASALTMYAGRNVTTTIAASDDVAITRVTFTSTLGGVAATPIVLTPNAKLVADTSFVVNVPPSTPAGTTLRLDVTVADAQPEHTLAVSKTITILKDAIAPHVTMTKPVASATVLDEATARTIDVEANVVDGETGVKQVFAIVDGASYAMSAAAGSSIYTVSVPMPDVFGTADVDVPVSVNASDYDGNATTSPVVNLHVRPFNNANAPVVTWLCPSTSSTNAATFPAGYTATLRVRALGNSVGDAANTVQKVELLVTLNGVTTTAPAPRVGTSDDFQTTFTIPASTPDGAVATIRAVATNLASLTNGATLNVTSVVVAPADNFTSSATIAATDTSHDNHAVAISGASTVVTISGTHALRNLIVLDGATLTHPPTGSTLPAPSISITSASSIYVGCGAFINADRKGYQDSVNDFGRTWPGTTANGSGPGSGGSHGGNGKSASGAVVGATYGSPYDPNEPGSAGGTGGSRTTNEGGGIVRLQATSVAVDGAVTANGDFVGWANFATAGGAGGSIRIDAATLAGSGVIRADAARDVSPGGGGGRVAVYYQTLALPRANISASGALNAGAGSIYFRRNDATGAKVADELLANGYGSAITQPLADLGAGTVVSVSGATVTLSGNVPEWIEGSTIDFTSATGAVWSSVISACGNDGKSVVLASAANVAAGQQYRGLWAFDRMTVTGGATLAAGGIRTPLVTTDSSSSLSVSELRAADFVLHGQFESNGSFGATNATIESNSIVTHATGSRVSMNVSGTLTVDATSRIDATAKGEATNANGSDAGGSHGGEGGHTNAFTPSFGSLFDPNEPGGASAGSGNNGGGIVRINAGTLALGGQIAADGSWTNNRTNFGGGAGGSIRIDAGSITGTGTVHANGADTGWPHGGGGGGRIAIYATSNALPLANITAHGGTGGSADGAAGTIFQKNAAQSYGDLRVDNGTVVSSATTTLTAIGSGIVTSYAADSITDAAAHFAAPDVLRGIRVVLNGDASKQWPVTSNTSTTIHVTPDASFTPAIGVAYRGVDRFDHLTLTNAHVETVDLLVVENTTLRDAASTLISGNLGAPIVDVARIHIAATPLGQSVIGDSGAISDPDKPLTVLVTNTRTNVTTQTVANDDGSFTAAVVGNAGDAITVSARDAHRFPLTSAPVTIGALAVDSGSTTQIPRTAWSVDATFRPHLLALEGFTLGIAGDYASPSDKVVLYDVSSPLAPSLLRTVSVGNGTVHALAFSGGWAFVASDSLRTFALGAANPAIHAPDVEVPAVPSGVAVFGTTAYVGDGSGNGRVLLYDVSDPAAPKKTETHDVLPNVGGALAFTSFVRGGNYLFASAPAAPNGVGHDLVVVDTHDPSNWQKVADVDVPNFAAWTSRLVGNTLYLSGRWTGGDVVPVDVSNPLHPLVLTRIAAGTPANGIDAAGTTLYAAASQSLVSIDGSSVISVPVGAPAADVRIGGGAIYVAHDEGLAVVPAASAPVVSARLVQLASGGATAIVTGTRGAVIGSGALTVTIFVKQNAVTANVAADGTFSAAITAAAGDAVTLQASDAASRKSAVVAIGVVPEAFAITQTASLATMNGGDANFRARNFAREGNWLAVAGSYQNDAPFVGSDSIAIFDISNPAIPAYRQTIRTGSGFVRGVAIQNGWLFIASGGLRTVQLGTSVIHAPAQSSGLAPSALAISGSYAYLAVTDCCNGYIDTFDISDPANPRLVRTTPALSGAGITSLAAIGTRYLAAVSPFGTGANRDMQILDVGAMNAPITRASHLDLGATFSAWTARVAGNALYVYGADTGVATVDVSDPLAPVLKSVIDTPGITYGGDRASSATTLGVADGAQGLTFVDVANATAPHLGASQPLTGTAKDILWNGNVVYVASEQSLLTITGVAAPPAINASLIAIAPDGVVSGARGAITGAAATTVTISGGVTPVFATVDTTGAFTATIAATAGTTLTAQATDGLGRTSAAVVIGTMPAGVIATTVMNATINGGDANFRPRILAKEGNWLAVASAYLNDSPFTGSDAIAIFDVTNPAAPAYRHTIRTQSGAVRGMVIRNGWLFVASGGLRTIRLGTTVVHAADHDSGLTVAGITVAGTFAYIPTSDCCNGYLTTYDISDPASPRLLRTDLESPGTPITSVTTIGTKYLAAVAPFPVNGVDHDLMIFDRSDPSVAPVRIQDLDLGGATFHAWSVRATGNMLTIYGADAGVALVDVTNPAAPVLKSITNTPGIAFSGDVDASATRIAVADGTEGLTFLDVTTPSAPRVAGSQPLAGTVNDAFWNGNVLYAATEQGVITISAIAAPPRIDATLITVAPNGTISGSAGAVTGGAGITLTITAGGAQVIATVDANGAFSTTINAAAATSVFARAADASGRTSATVAIGVIPAGAGAESATLATVNGGDANFRGRVLARGGNWLAVAGSYLNDLPFVGSDAIAIFDITNAAMPVYRHTIRTQSGAVRGLVIRNGWLFVASGGLRTIQLGTTVVHTPDRDSGLTVAGVTVDGAFAYVPVSDCCNGYLATYDISDPASPRLLRTDVVSPGTGITSVTPIGTKYLAAVAPGPVSGVGHDLMIFDRSNVAASPVKIQDLDLGGSTFHGWSVRATGNMLTIYGGDAGVALVDITNPAAPVVRSITNTPGISFGGDVSSSSTTIAVADGTQGLAFLDAANPSTPRITGSTPILGTVYDASWNGNVLYALTEQSLVTISAVDAPPRIEPSLITIAPDGTLTGTAGSVVGASPVTLTITSGTRLVSANVDASGAFTATIAAAAAATIFGQAVDGSHRTSASVAIAVMPAGAVAESATLAAINGGDANFRARNLAREANWLAVGGAYINDPPFVGSDAVALVDISNPAAPVYRQTIRTLNGAVRGVAMRNGWLFVASGNGMRTIQLGTTTIHPPDRDGGRPVSAITADGNYAYVSANDCCNLFIDTYDVANPASPRLLRTDTVLPGATVASLVTIGAKYLAAVAPSVINGAGHDLMIFDRSNAAAGLVKLKDLDIGGATFSSWTCRLSGNMLTIFAADAGVALVDVTDPANPIVKSIVDTPGVTYAGDASDSIVAAGDGLGGVTFVDAANAAQPKLLGSLSISGIVYDALYGANALYTATDRGVSTISGIAAAPVITPSLITVTITGGNAVVSGASASVTGGTGSIALILRNGAAMTTPILSATGSFSALLPAAAGDELTLQATDAAGRIAGPVSLGLARAAANEAPTAAQR